MKQRGYRLRFDNEQLSVEHRASFRPRTVVLLSTAYLCYCALPHVRKVLVDTYAHHDPVVACFALLFLLIPPLSFSTWLFFASGEVLRCDRHELQIAKRRTLGRWYRLRCPSAEVQQLQYAWRGGPKRRSYSVLTFQYQGHTFDILEELERSDIDRVLQACKSLGLDTVPHPVGPDAAMLKDIKQRGWFINPLKPENHKPQ